jgi:hypothetical protein
MEFWDLLRREIEHARIVELNKMEGGAFCDDLSAYNRSVGFLKGLAFVESCVMNNGEKNVEDGAQD